LGDVDLAVFIAFSGLIGGLQAAVQIKRYGMTRVIVG
jgi:hypothetical protein